MSKRITSLILALLIIFSATGCNQGESKKTETTTANTAETITEVTSQSTETQPTTQKPKALTGFKVLVDAGHGCTGNYVEQKYPGADETTVENSSTGTTGVVTKKREGELTLEIALLLEKELKKLGATVYMIRRTQGTPMSLQDRAEYGNNKNVDLAFRIHADGLDDATVSGASVLYPASDYVGEEICEKSKIASQCVLKSYIKATGFNNRGVVSRNDLVGFNFTKVPCILIEMGFMTNADDDRLMSDKNFQQKMVKGMADGILQYKKS